jgi:hypothetical protein
VSEQATVAEVLTWVQQMHGYQQAMNGKLDELAAMHAELPEHLQSAWPTYEWSYQVRLPARDPRAMLDLHMTVRATGLHFRLRLNANIVVWEREVFFREAAR